MKKSLLSFSIFLLLGATALAGATYDPEDVTFADKGYNVFVISGKTAQQMSWDCGCRSLILPKEKVVILLNVKEMGI